MVKYTLFIALVFLLISLIRELLPYQFITNESLAAQTNFLSIAIFPITCDNTEQIGKVIMLLFQSPIHFCCTCVYHAAVSSYKTISGPNKRSWWKFI